LNNSFPYRVRQPSILSGGDFDLLAEARAEMSQHGVVGRTG
jgi:hypothetical protein